MMQYESMLFYGFRLTRENYPSFFGAPTFTDTRPAGSCNTIVRLGDR